MRPTDLDGLISHRFTQLDTLRLHWVEAGKGPVVVLLHGFPEMWWSWRYQIRPLAEAGFRVVVPDQRGYNDTDKQGPFDLDTLAADVCHLVDSLGAGQKVRIVGHDWGGAVAWHLAATRPEHCDRVAVVNCPHPGLMRTRIWRPRQLKKSWYMFFFQLPWLPERALTRDGAAGLMRALKGNALDRAHFSDDELQPFREALLKPGAATAMVNWYRTASRTLLKAYPYPPIEAATLLVWGMNDGALGFDDVVPGTEALAPKLEVMKIENAGHFVQAERPDDVTRGLLEFISR